MVFCAAIVNPMTEVKAVGDHVMNLMLTIYQGFLPVGHVCRQWTAPPRLRAQAIGPAVERSMTARGLQPDDITFATLLDVCIEKSNVSAVSEILNLSTKGIIKLAL